MVDYLAVGQLVTGVVQGVGAAVDPYFYTQQEQTRDGLAGQAIDAQKQATAAQLAAVQAREATTQKAITYTLAGVLGVSGVFLASRLIGGQ